MLWEMLQGEILQESWQDERIKHAMDLCLSCKACKSECPTNVDIATYRSEFLSHYYETRRRPLHAYAFGMIDRWARLGSIAPGVANAFARAPGVTALLRTAKRVCARMIRTDTAASPLPSNLDFLTAMIVTQWLRGC